MHRLSGQTDSDGVSARVATRRRVLRQMAVAGAALLCGCTGHGRPSKERTDESLPVDVEAEAYTGGDDPCAARLHDLCGVLLLHVMRQGRLPAKLEELGPLPGGGGPAALVCAVSGEAYIYNPTGIYLADHEARLVVYDPAPSHGGRRWGIIAVEATETDPLLCKVISLPESFFVLRPPR